MAVISIDIGTTHCKVALLDRGGTFLDLFRGNTRDCWAFDGTHLEYDPHKLWALVVEGIRQVSKGREASIELISIAGMAEAGLFVKRSTGEPLCPIMPWFDGRPKLLSEEYADSYERFCRTGLPLHHKFGFFKMAYRLRTSSFDKKECLWLSLPDYIAMRLTGLYATDPTLAARTWLYDIFAGQWMGEYLLPLGLDESNLPQVLPSGAPLGEVTIELGLPSSTLVAISGHDHLCAGAVSGLAAEGALFDSLGTAETLMGSLSLDGLGQKEFDSGFLFGRQATGERHYWLGSLAASGDSVDWAKEMLCDAHTSYDELFKLLEPLGKEPTGMVYLPYINGSNYPHASQGARGSIHGIQRKHTKGEFFKAVLEGTAFEMEWMRQKASRVFGQSWDTIHCVGGGTKNPPWMQIKADVSLCTLYAPLQAEATLLGCAYIAQPAIGGEAELASRRYTPDEAVHQAYKNLFEHVYLPMQEHGENLTLWREQR